MAMTTAFFKATTLCMLLLFGMHITLAAFSGEAEEKRYPPESIREFLLGMSPPMNRGDWAAFQGNGRKTVASIVESAGEGSRQRLVVEIREYGADGEPAGVETRERIVSDAAAAIADRHEYFTIAPVTATIKGEPVRAALLRGFRDDRAEAEYTISSEVPLGEIVRHDANGSEATLVDYGWGDEAFHPAQTRLPFAQAAERIAAALPEPGEGEWGEYFAPGMPGNAVKRYHIACGVDGRTGGRILSLYAVPDEDGHPVAFARMTTAEAREYYGEPLLREGAEYCTITRDTILAKGEEKPVLSLNAFNKGLFGARILFSAELPCPWLADVALVAEEGEWSGLRLLDWGWRESEDIEARERRTTVADAIGEVVDAGLATAAAGDWALYENSNGGRTRYEHVAVRSDWHLPRYVNLIRHFDASGKIAGEEEKVNTRDEIVDGFILGGDAWADRFTIARSEATVMGETLAILSITGFREEKPVYRIDLSGQAPAAQLVNLVLFEFSPEPILKLVEFGKR